MGDYLDIYAKADVQDFPKAILKVCEFYNDFGLCPIKDCISIPSMSIRLMSKLTDPTTVWYLPPKNAQSVTETLQTGIVGGLAEVWTRLHVQGLTTIRGGLEVCNKVAGEDCSAMYLVS